MSRKQNNRGRRSRSRSRVRHADPRTEDAFSRLPDELVLAVLARMTKPVDIVRFGATSRRMREISLDDSLWRFFFQQQHHPLTHARFAEFGKTWLWLFKVCSQSRAVAARAPNVWSYAGDTDEGGRPHGYCAGHYGVQRYEGEWMRGYMHGRGVRTFADGSVHVGTWSFNAASGHGTRVYADDSRYDGTWKVGMRHGHGVHTFANGDVYEGEWEWDKQHGRGAIIAHDGTRYTGQWHKDRLLDHDDDPIAADAGRARSQTVQQRSPRPGTTPSSPARKNPVFTRPK
ncbi:Morn repeat domain containing protein [Pandoravirus quercus]|uniref:Morn repeat domain containing protein n=2 Tax=Pandoravirus TaxID=2060084 RepID=A0A2U7U916_9VIRU|nr:Morn repeat domain containing protein [Pandoravirus quercus]AVK74934.1 Morn repeat domain containing protein [Pandoravirus quercus]QBZ81121.1 morn repeat incomplete domain containing protein [Pandoravirus celtis]